AVTWIGMLKTVTDRPGQPVLNKNGAAAHPRGNAWLLAAAQKFNEDTVADRPAPFDHPNNLHRERFDLLPFEDRITLAFHPGRNEEHTSELQSRENLVCRLLLEKKKNHKSIELH